MFFMIFLLIWDVLKVLFYCYFFVLVDCVFSMENGEVYVLKNVIINELFFMGYFFIEFVMFGVLIIEVLV